MIITPTSKLHRRWSWILLKQNSTNQCQWSRRTLRKNSGAPMQQIVVVRFWDYCCFLWFNRENIFHSNPITTSFHLHLHSFHIIWPIITRKFRYCLLLGPDQTEHFCRLKYTRCLTLPFLVLPTQFTQTTKSLSFCLTAKLKTAYCIYS